MSHINMNNPYCAHHFLFTYLLFFDNNLILI
jgi:hypothetical protein